jgi:hypothetical protein
LEATLRTGRSQEGDESKDANFSVLDRVGEKDETKTRKEEKRRGGKYGEKSG